MLTVEQLRVQFSTREGVVHAVNGISFCLKEGEILGIVGESGCGKTVTSLSLMRLVPPPGQIVSGKIFFERKDLLNLSEKEMRNFRGNMIAMIFQDPLSSLNPVMRIREQIHEILRIHLELDREEATLRIKELLKMVGILNAEDRMNDYPFQFSGGMRQRVMIAMALACRPQLLIADEPTTALDVTIQAQILRLLKRLRAETKTAILLITHNMGIVAGMCDRVIVMYAGEIVEEANVMDLFQRPAHPYTIGLLNSIPRIKEGGSRKLYPINGMPPDLYHLRDGCQFAPRCSFQFDRCLQSPPKLVEIEDETQHRVACWQAEYHRRVL